MEIGVGDHRQSRSDHFVEKHTARGNFPGVEMRSEAFAPIPEKVGLLFKAPGRHRVGGDGEPTLRVDRGADLLNGEIRVDPFGNAEGEHVGGSLIQDRVLRQLDPRNEEHVVFAARPLRFAPEDLTVQRKRRPGQRLVEVARGLAKHRGSFAEVVGNRDGAEATRAVEVHELRDRELPVAERRMHVEIG